MSDYKHLVYVQLQSHCINPVPQHLATYQFVVHLVSYHGGGDFHWVKFSR